MTRHKNRAHGQDPNELPWVLESGGLYYVLSSYHQSQGAIAAGATELHVEVMRPAFGVYFYACDAVSEGLNGEQDACQLSPFCAI